MVSFSKNKPATGRSTAFRLDVGVYDLPGDQDWTVGVAAGERGLRRLRIHRERISLEDWVASLDHPGPVRQGGTVLDAFWGELERYMDGDLRRFRTPIDFAGQGTEFQRRVWSALCRIPWGHTCSYAELARSAACPLGARAVGQANGKNPLPIIVPCHRVVAADGALGGFTGGLEVKRWLLGLEGVTIPKESGRLRRAGA